MLAACMNWWSTSSCTLYVGAHTDKCLAVIIELICLQRASFRYVFAVKFRSLYSKIYLPSILTKTSYIWPIRILGAFCIVLRALSSSVFILESQSFGPLSPPVRSGSSDGSITQGMAALIDCCGKVKWFGIGRQALTPYGYLCTRQYVRSWLGSPFDIVLSAPLGIFRRLEVQNNSTS
jgi:hypothetical protein